MSAGVLARFQVTRKEQRGVRSASSSGSRAAHRARRGPPPPWREEECAPISARRADDRRPAGPGSRREPTSPVAVSERTHPARPRPPADAAARAFVPSPPPSRARSSRRDSWPAIGRSPASRRAGLPSWPLWPRASRRSSAHAWGACAFRESAPEHRGRGRSRTVRPSPRPGRGDRAPSRHPSPRRSPPRCSSDRS